MAFTDYETEQLRRALLKETRHCAVTLGMKKTSVDQLTKAVGIAKGSFYKFYESKEMLFFAVWRIFTQNSMGWRIRCWKRWCTALAGSYLNKRKAAGMRLFQDMPVSRL